MSLKIYKSSGLDRRVIRVILGDIERSSGIMSDIVGG